MFLLVLVYSSCAPQNCLYLFLSSSSFFILIPSSSSVHTNSHTHNHVWFEVHPQGPRLRRPPPCLRYTLRAHYSLTHYLPLSLSPSRRSVSHRLFSGTGVFGAQERKKAHHSLHLSSLNWIKPPSQESAAHLAFLGIQELEVRDSSWRDTTPRVHLTKDNNFRWR